MPGPPLPLSPAAPLHVTTFALPLSNPVHDSSSPRLRSLLRFPAGIRWRHLLLLRHRPAQPGLGVRQLRAAHHGVGHLFHRPVLLPVLFVLWPGAWRAAVRIYWAIVTGSRRGLDCSRSLACYQWTASAACAAVYVLLYVPGAPSLALTPQQARPPHLCSAAQHADI